MCLRSNAILNPGILVVLVYSALYIIWDMAAGLSWALCVALPLWLAANAFQQQVRRTMQQLAWFQI